MLKIISMIVVLLAAACGGVTHPPSTTQDLVYRHPKDEQIFHLKGILSGERLIYVSACDTAKPDACSRLLSGEYIKSLKLLKLSEADSQKILAALKTGEIYEVKTDDDLYPGLLPFANFIQIPRTEDLKSLVVKCWRAESNQASSSLILTLDRSSPRDSRILGFVDYEKREDGQTKKFQFDVDGGGVFFTKEREGGFTGSVPDPNGDRHFFMHYHKGQRHFHIDGGGRDLMIFKIDRHCSEFLVDTF